MLYLSDSLDFLIFISGKETNVNFLLERLFPSIIWSVKTEQPSIYLTFDDGPHPIYTPKILEILNRKNAKASFFLIGNRAIKHKKIVQLIYEQKHTIGIHSQNHPYMIFKTTKTLQQEIDRSISIVTDITSQKPAYFRPPYGYFTPKLIKLVHDRGLQFVMWTHMTYDFADKVSEKKIYCNIRKNMKRGTILVFHDGHRNSNRTVSILPEIIDIIKDHNMLCSNL